MARTRKFTPLKAMPNGSPTGTQTATSHVTRGEPFSEYATKRRPFARNAANARERCRMRVLSKAFCRLKTCLPWVPPDTKLSKLDTLRLASSYIAHLRGLLADDDSSQDQSGQRSTNAHPASMSWPYAAAASLQEQRRSASSSTTSGVPESSSESSCEYSMPPSTNYHHSHSNQGLYYGADSSITLDSNSTYVYRNYCAY